MKLQLPDFSKARVIVYGDVILDRYWYGKTSRISPEAPVPVVHVQEEQERPGGAGNVALNLANLGADVDLYGLIGDDPAGSKLAQLLEQEQVSVHFSVQAGWPTTTKLRLLSSNQQLVRMDFEGPTAILHSLPLMQACQQKMQDANLLVLSDYHKGALIDPQYLIQTAVSIGLYVVVDPKQLDFSVYRGASIITPNFKEFTAVVGECIDEAAMIEKGLNLLQEHAFKALLITRGEEGMTLIEAQGEPFHLPAKAPEVFDVTGAGDTVVATLAGALASGEGLHHAIRLANAAAGIVVGRLGVASVTASELHHAMQAQAHPLPIESSKMHDVWIHPIISACHTRGETVALVIGDFDTVRLEQLDEIAAIKKRFDRMIVGVVAEELLSLQPVQSLQARLTVIAGFKEVDWTVPIVKVDWLKELSDVSFNDIFYMSNLIPLLHPLPSEAVV